MHMKPKLESPPLSQSPNSRVVPVQGMKLITLEGRAFRAVREFLHSHTLRPVSRPE